MKTSRQSRHECTPAPVRRAFTLLELLIVIGIIVLLVSLVVTGMFSVRNAANRANTMGALRQMVTGYGAYTTDHGGRLMPGYVDSSLIGTGANQLDIQAEFSDGVAISTEASQSYAWRLAPYLDYAWDAYYVDFRSRSVTSRLENEMTQLQGGAAIPQAQIDAATLEISELVSIGMNSLFVGGDSAHGGSAMTDNHPWINQPDGNPNQWAVTNLSRVRNPATLIVFAPAGEFDAWVDGLATYEKTSGAPHENGFPELRPPWLPDGSGQFVNQQWSIGQGSVVGEPASGSLEQSGGGAGLPIIRWGTDTYTVAHLDGSTATESLGLLSVDMTRWTNFSLQELQDRGFNP